MIGLTNLHQALSDEPLKFFLLFSSVANGIPYLGAGQSDYAMANAYMDFYANYQAGQGQVGIQSIQWPAWKETGMVAGGMDTPPAYEMSGLQSLNTADGLQLIEMVRQLDEPVCMPAVIDPGRFKLDELLYRKEPITWNPTIKEIDGHSKEETVLGERAQAVKWLKEIFQKELKLIKAPPDEHISFTEYGGGLHYHCSNCTSYSAENRPDDIPPFVAFGT